MKRTYLYLAIITAIGAFLRLFQLGKDSLWLDESFQIVFSAYSIPEILSDFSRDVHPPLTMLISHVMLYITGPSEIGIRLFPALCGIIAIPVFYLIGKEALDENSGLLMAAMLAVSQLGIHYSGEARMYSLVLLATSGGFYFWLRFIRTTHTKHLIFFSVAFTVAMYSHFFALIPFVILALLLPTMLDRLKAVFLTGLLCLPLVGPALQMSSHQLSLQVTGLMGLEVANSVLWNLAGFNPIGFLLLITLFIVGTYELWQSNKRLCLACACLVVGSITFGCLISLIGVHQEARYYIYLLPAFFLPIAAVVKEIGGMRE